MAASSAFLPGAEDCPPFYRPRNPRATSLYQLLDKHYETVKLLWEQRFERRYGFWQGYRDNAVASYLDCGLFESGFARAVCPKCRFEFLVALSCKGRGLCPSCGAKRAALFSALLQEHILADVPHAQWVFSLPKMLRLYFLFHRELLGEFARLAYETVREMMAAAVDEPDARPGMVAVIQTFSSSLRWNPHIHAIASRGLWTPDGVWVPVPYVDEHRAELLFRHKMFRLLRDRGLISQERIDLLLSWRHSGFSVHNRTTVYPNDTEGLHKLACYLMRAPVNLSRLRFDRDSGLLVFEPKPGHELDDEALTDPLEFLARVLVHIPEPNKHLVRFYGAYANRVRSETIASNHSAVDGPEGTEEAPQQRRALRKRWAELVYRIYEVDPLTCPRCRGKMKLLAFIVDPAVIRRILDHLQHKAPSRAPPEPSELAVH
ncbi:MAG TPA: transposase [Vicinamibacteria bacterium]|nr:transposase [Vicinamibacteria bacterium]